MQEIFVNACKNYRQIWFFELCYHMTFNQKKALLKRSADTLEKLAVGSLLVGLFKDAHAGIFIGLVCIGVSIG